MNIMRLNIDGHSVTRGLRNFNEWRDEFIIELSTLFLMGGFILGTIDVLGGSTLSSSPIFAYAWAIIQACAIDGLFFAIWGRVGTTIKNKGNFWLIASLIVLGIILGAVAALVNGVLSYQDIQKNVTLAEAMGAMGVTSKTFSIVRAVLVVLVSIFVCVFARGNGYSVRDLKEEIDGLRQLLNMQPGEAEWLRTVVQSLRVTVGTLRGTLSQKEQEIERLRSMLAQVQSENKNLQSTVDGLQSENKSLQGKLTGAVQAIEGTRSIIDKTVAENESLRSTIEQNSREIDGLRSTVDGLHTRIKGLRSTGRRSTEKSTGTPSTVYVDQKKDGLRSTDVATREGTQKSTDTRSTVYVVPQSIQKEGEVYERIKDAIIARTGTSYTYKNIASDAGCSEGAVKKHAPTIKQALQFPITAQGTQDTEVETREREAVNA
jgi:cell division protein FtsB